MNIRDLHEKLRAHFGCIDGLPRNYMEIRCRLPQQQDPLDIHVARFVYQSVGVTICGEPEDVEPILCLWFWQRMATAFSKEDLEDRNVLLIWRKWPLIESYIDKEGHTATKLRARFVIPADDLKRVFGDTVVGEGELLYKL